MSCRGETTLGVTPEESVWNNMSGEKTFNVPFAATIERLVVEGLFAGETTHSFPTRTVPTPHTTVVLAAADVVGDSCKAPKIKIKMCNPIFNYNRMPVEESHF